MVVKGDKLKNLINKIENNSKVLQSETDNQHTIRSTWPSSIVSVAGSQSVIKKEGKKQTDGRPHYHRLYNCSVYPQSCSSYITSNSYNLISILLLRT